MIVICYYNSQDPDAEAFVRGLHEIHPDWEFRDTADLPTSFAPPIPVALIASEELIPEEKQVAA